MPLSESIFSYEDIRAILDRALESPNGVRLSLKSHGAAIHFRQRAYKFRQLDRKNSHTIFDESDQRRGTSAYDCLVVEAVDNTILVKKTNVERLLEELEEL